ncbi:MAG TPA: TonB-dependent receptor [Thermoanaerobaculia bacterium]|nr:TonB-dependent receptor [Thermoanaerobaculia bacterium]
MRRQFWLVLVLLMALPVLAFAQGQTTGRITGTVTDEQGAPVAGATVTVSNTELQLERTTTTGPSGEFLFALLPVGPYSATVTGEGRQPQVLTFRLGVGETVPLNVQLSPGDVIAEEITVTGTATALETTTVGENFDYEEQIDQLPIPDRAIEDVASLSPNISFGPTPGSIAIAGAPSFDTTILLDGAEVSDPYFGSAPVVYLEDAIEEVQVLTSGISARYGRFQGGVINAVTKSGSNEFEGTLRAEFDKGEWNSQTPFKETQSDILNKVYQATLGGYILRDRLWFFAGGRTIPEQAQDFTTTSTRESFQRLRNEDRWQAKVRGAITENHLVDLSYLSYEAETDPYNGLTAGDDRALGKRSDPRETTTLNYQGVLSANTFLELQGTKKDVQIFSGGDPAKGDPFIDNATSVVYNNHWWDFEDPSTRNNRTASANLTHSLATSSFGSHTLEGGIQWVESTTGGENRQSSTGLNFLALNTLRDFYAGQVNGEPRFNVYTGQAARWEALPLGGEQVIENTGAYVQDGMTLGKFRFDVGVRYDKYDGSGPLAEFNIDFDDIAPRLGVTYSINPAWQLQATYGRYVSRFNDRVSNNVTGVGSAPRVTTLYNGPTILGATAEQIMALLHNNANWQQVIGYNNPRQASNFQDSDISAPYANDLNFSVRHALPRNTGSVVLAYIDREYRDLLDDFVGEVCQYGFSVDGCNNTTTITNPAGGRSTVDTRIYSNNPNAKRDYQALNLIWDYRPTSHWLISGNYTYSETRGNYEGEGRNTPASGSIQGDYVRSIDQAAAIPYGVTDDDIPHRFIGLASYTMDFNRLGALTFGSVLTFQSGYAYSLTGLVPLRSIPEYASESGTYTYYFGENGEANQHERGSRRFNDWWQLDFSTGYELPIFSDFNVWLKVAVTNILDNDELIAHQTSGVARLDAAGNVLGWAPAGNCGLNDEPSRNCTGFGRIRDQLDYQDPREFLFTVAIDF